jgi:hypothetical protein
VERPTLQDYGLSPEIVSAFEAREKTVFSVVPHICRIGGALGGFVVGVLIASGPHDNGVGVGVVFAFFGFVIALIFADGFPAFVSKLTRPREYAEFKAALRAFEEWDLRTRSAFWTSLSGHEFERELAKLFQSHGYSARVTRGSGDHGVDIFLQRAGRTTVVQCKQNKNPVGPAVARELLGALIASGADDGILAAVGGVTTGVHAFFWNKPLRVMDLSEILTLQSEIQNPREAHSGEPSSS